MALAKVFLFDINSSLSRAAIASKSGFSGASLLSKRVPPPSPRPPLLGLLALLFDALAPLLPCSGDEANLHDCMCVMDGWMDVNDVCNVCDVCDACMYVMYVCGVRMYV